MKFPLDVSKDDLYKILTEIAEVDTEFFLENPRNIILIGTSKIDFLLKEILEKAFVIPYNRSVDILENISFSQKTKLLFLLNLIDKDLSEIIHSLRILRNIAAHKTILESSAFNNIKRWQERFLEDKERYNLPCVQLKI